MAVKTRFRLFVAMLLLTVTEVSLAQVQHMPAYPLLTRNTFFSVWTFSDTLNNDVTRHWSGVPQRMDGFIQVDSSTYSFMGLQLTYQAQYKAILPTSDQQAYVCPYLESTPAAGWQNLAFDDSSWPVGQAVFSNNTQAQTPWNTSDIYVRRVFTLDSLNADKLLLKLYHDDNVEVYLNGVEVYSETGYNATYQYFPITNNLVKGQNILAIHCHNSYGGSALDGGLVDGSLVDSTLLVKKAVQNSLNVTATQTFYDFTCGGVTLDVDFISPLLLSDLDVLGRPVSYISYKAKSNDGKPHNVKIYFGAPSTLSTTSYIETTQTTKYAADGLSILKCGTLSQPILQTTPNLIDWGYVYVAVPQSYNAEQFISQNNETLNPFYRDTASVSNKGDAQVLSTVIPFGTVGPQETEKVVEIGYDELYPVQYFNQNLVPWWKTGNNKTIEDELMLADTSYTSITNRCNTFDANLYTDALKAGGTNYAKLCVMAYRQAIAAGTIVRDPQGDTLYYAKENSSGGFVNTVDVSYPSSPLFALYNPKLVEGLMNGIYYYCESGKWSTTYAPHDFGEYPLGDGIKYPFGMPVEESGNMILMTAAAEKSEGNTDFAKRHWALLTQWANYLVSVGYDPPYQFTSDDFAGPIAGSVNLSAKLINAVGAYAGMARAMGDTAAFNKYYAGAQHMAIQWVTNADAGDHYLLAFGTPDTTWCQKYNIIWDKLLGMNLFPQSVYDKEVKYYITKLNPYGLPLDERQTYTKSDWSMWTATMAGNMSDFITLSNPIYKFANQTASRVPLTDFYQTTTGLQDEFQGRSVVGGFFIKMLLRSWQLSSTCSAPVNLSTDSITQTGAAIHWSVNASAENFILQGKPADSANWHTYTLPVTDSSFNITGLLPKTTYQWRIASLCQAEPQVVSDYSAIQTFTTLANPDTLKTGGFSITLSPNPAVNTANINIKNAKGNVTVKLISMAGRVIWQTRGNYSSFAIPLADVSDGVYIVSVRDDTASKSLKLIKTN